MKSYPIVIQDAIEQFSKLPGVGTKTAERFCFHLLKSDKQFAQSLATAIFQMKEKISSCQVCHNYSESDICEICRDPKREEGLICIVAHADDTFILEGSGYRGKYHVLGGLISPLDGVGPEDLQISTLKSRLSQATELLFALDSSIEGDATTLYLKQNLKGISLRTTRLARGLPANGTLTYVDSQTLSQSINERTPF